MNTANQKDHSRWVLLRHTGSPEDSRGFHFDLLLEDQKFCRTWRLSDIPLLDGPYVESLFIPPHDLYWLDIEEKLVSGNRGIATRVKQGIFFNSLPINLNSSLDLSLQWEDNDAYLLIDKNGCKVLSKKNNYCL